jgi:hypothetical protein
MLWREYAVVCNGEKRAVLSGKSDAADAVSATRH